MRQNSLDWLTK